MCLDAVSGPTEAQESGAADLIRTSARLGGRQHEEPGSCDLHVPGPCKEWLQRGEQDGLFLSFSSIKLQHFATQQTF